MLESLRSNLCPDSPENKNELIICTIRALIEGIYESKYQYEIGLQYVR